MLYLYDDEVARQWQPFALTRPIGELLLGAYTFRARAERLFGMDCAGLISAPHLLGFQEHDGAAVIDPDTIPTDRPRLFLSSRALPDWAAAALLTGEALLSGPAALRIEGVVVGRAVPAGASNPDPSFFTNATPDTTDLSAAIDLPGRVLRHVWELVAKNAAQIAIDYEASRTGDGAGAGRGGDGAGGGGGADEEGRAGQYQAIGYRAGLLRLGTGVAIEPNVVLDFTHGPIWLEDGVTVRAFTRLNGPAWIGARTTLLGGPFDAVSIGPVCKVHGELEETVVLGYSNKAHDGFLGHAYLGRWVNLGALTTNSDLKNNYGTIRMWTPDGDADTGVMKLGCLIGDHAKTGIGALINTGTIIGAGSNLYGTDMPPKYVPPFSWGTGSSLAPYDVDRFIGVAEAVLARRELELSGRMRDILREAWRIGRGG